MSLTFAIIANILAPMSAPWMMNPPTDLQGKVALLERKKEYLKSPGPKGQFLRAIFKEVQTELREAKELAKRLDPLAFFKPSYEQALILNSWMYGFTFLFIFSANRIGKTTASIINFLLWIFPNNPQWLIFQPYTDHLGRLVQVYPRPDFAKVKEIGKLIATRPLDLKLKAPDHMLPTYHPTNQAILQWLQKLKPSLFKPAYPNAPWNKGGQIWYGAPDHDHHKKTIMPLWKEYIPQNSLLRYSVSDREITIEVKHPTGRTTAWEWSGKSYESEDTKWSSGAVDAIGLTEGVPPAIFKEVKLRFKDPGLGTYDYTPYLPANSGAASALASRIAKGTEPVPLRPAVFTKFRVYDAPAHIIPEDKRLDLIRSYENDPEGKARLEGEFYTSSGLVLSRLDRIIHLLPFSYAEMLHRFPRGNHIRGLDPGLDHPAACAWGYLLPTNQIIFYQFHSEQGLTIDQRCEKWIKMSGNKRVPRRYGPGPQDFYYQEVRAGAEGRTIMWNPMDYHAFKKDETTGKTNALNYMRAGVRVIQSTHLGPEDRAVQFNNDLQVQDRWIDVRTFSTPAPRIYFLKKGIGVEPVIEKWLEFFWDRVKSGANKGMPNDKVPSHGDDELDAACYVGCGPFTFTDQEYPDTVIEDEELEQELIEASQSALKTPLQPLQKHQRETVIFGGE